MELFHAGKGTTTILSEYGLLLVKWRLEGLDANTGCIREHLEVFPGLVGYGVLCCWVYGWIIRAVVAEDRGRANS